MDTHSALLEFTKWWESLCVLRQLIPLVGNLIIRNFFRVGQTDKNISPSVTFTNLIVFLFVSKTVTILVRKVAVKDFKGKKKSHFQLVCLFYTRDGQATAQGQIWLAAYFCK